jgi:NAD(H)-dependent 7beta-hydroxy-3-oxo-delta4-cholenoic acid oxidoreductase
MSNYKLFSPIEIGSMRLKNRLAMAPMTTAMEAEDGTVGESLSDFWEARAKGGVGLIIMDMVTVDGSVPYAGNTIGLYDDRFIPPLSQFVDRIHSYGTRIIPQIVHPGAETISCLFGAEAVGPSAYLNGFGKMVRELRRDEIPHIIQLFGEAARRARDAGCDGAEFHSAHAYALAGSFLSPLRNKRTDEYGGSLDNRARLAIEIIKAMKEKAGKDFPLIMRISGDETTPGGNMLQDMLYLVPKFIEAGIDAFDVSGGEAYGARWRILPSYYQPAGLNVSEASAIKSISGVPVLVVGKINDVRFAEHILKSGYADGIIMGRALVADPELPNKAMEGRFDDIMPCAYCMNCFPETDGRHTSACSINAAVGKEGKMEVIPTAEKKKVLVAGGGPAGLEAARVAALRGHDVTLYEKSDKLGGQVNLAAVPPLKQELSKWIVYLSGQVYKNGVKVRRNTEVTAALVRKEGPDVFISAVGSVPVVPNIKVSGNDNIVTGDDVLKGAAIITKGNILIIGGGSVGCEVAETIFENSPGKTAITIIDMLDDIALDMYEDNRKLMLERLTAKGTTIYANTKVLEINGDELKIDNNGHEEVLRGFSYIVLCVGSKPAKGIVDEIKDTVKEIYVVGDAKSARKVLYAVAEATEVAMKI